jgi:protocatechuate 3,4-dioxygenase beta subunit
MKRKPPDVQSWRRCAPLIVAITAALAGTAVFAEPRQDAPRPDAAGIQVRARFLDEAKKPIPRMKVQLGRCTKDEDGSDRFRGLMGGDGRWMITSTDEDGRFGFGGLGPGKYCFAAQPARSLVPSPVRQLTGEIFVFEVTAKSRSVDLGDHVVRIVLP